LTIESLRGIISDTVTLENAKSPATDDMEAFLRELVEEEGRAKATATSYRNTISKLLAAHPDKTFADFAYGDIEAFVEAAPPLSRGLRATPLRRWFKWGVRTGRLTEDFARLLPAYQWARSGPVQDLFSEDEIEALTSLPEPDGTLMALMFETGLAKGEASALKGGDFDLDRRRMHVVKGSRGSGARTVPLEDKLVNRIARSFVSQGITKGDYVWPTRPGGGRVQRNRPIHSASFHYWWRDALQAAGVTYRPAKQARHTCAMRLRNRGVTLADIQDILGHNSYYSTEQLYAAVRFNDVEKRFHEPLPRKVIEAITAYEWRVGYAVNPDQSYTVILLDKEGSKLFSARGTDFHDAILEAWKDVYPPSDEVLREQGT
jgi:integrase